ncbi:MAG: hypothetical protein R3D27_09420 [Hyphomicrobiaceae bacterium]
MARIFTLLVLVGFPLAAVVLYARVVEPGDWPLLSLARTNGAALDPVSIGIGAVAGYALAVLLRYPWAELPERFLRWLNRFVPGMQLAVCAAVCVAVLLYW